MTNTASMTLADAVLPRGRALRDALLVLGFGALLALSSQIALPLPGTPVPLTLQTLAVLVTGMVLGSRRGPLAVLAWLCAGLLGLPVLATGTLTGGYLAGFVAAAFLVGLLAERRWDRRPLTTVGAMVLGSVVIYACGAAWLAIFIGAKAAVVQGVLPFLVGDAIKIGAATAALPLAWSRLGRAEDR
ncbi:MAG TPA: biotin transporter BioY [Myxococcales bacterium]